MNDSNDPHPVELAPTTREEPTTPQDCAGRQEEQKKPSDIHDAENPPKTALPRLPAKKEVGPVAQLCEWVVKHQIGLSINLLMLLGLTHICFPRARRNTRKFYELSYYDPDSKDYTIGWNDACIVSYWIILFTGLRASAMDYVLGPFAQWAGIDKPRNVTRFAEQAWLLIYCTVSWSAGMYIMYNSDYWLDIKMVWKNWPDREISGALKWYILVQFAFWLQQIVIVNIEERRKDHVQMFTHHIITCMLLFTSYGYHQTKVANVILCLMDVVDLFLPLAKCLKYLGYGRICDVLFIIFMTTWVIARHGLYMMVCYSIWHDIPREINLGCYKGRKGALIGPFSPPDRFAHLLEPFRNPEGVVCFNTEIKWAFLTGLLLLQGLLLMWFWMICKVAVNVIKGGEADDTRSDDEEEEEENVHEAEEHPEEVEYVLEEDVGVEAINLKGRNASSRRYTKPASSSSGVTLAGHSDKKELLGRIGCERGV